MKWALATTPTPGADGPLSAPDWLPWWVPDWLPALLVSLVVVVVAWAVARLLVRLLNRRLARRYGRPSLTRTVLRAIQLGVYLFGLFLILSINGVQLGNIALSVTVFSAVIGVVLAPVIGSYISGVFLLADQPYEIGDMVELPDTDRRGFVEEITLRYTKIFTLDNTFVVIPNGTIRERDVINYSAEDPRTRQSIDVLVTYESDRETAQETIEAAARSVDGVIEGGPAIRIGAARYPAAPDCLVATFADNGMLLRLRYWVTEPYRIQTVRSRVQEEIDARLADTAVEYAYPHSHHFFDETSGDLSVTRRTGGDGSGPNQVDGSGPNQVDGSNGRGSEGTDPSAAAGDEADTDRGDGTGASDEV